MRYLSMRIGTFNSYYSRQTNNIKAYNSAPSFTAMKKSQFDGADYAAVEKYKAPIEKFNTNDDLQLWAGDKYNIICEQDYSGRNIDTLFQRRQSINKWSDSLDKGGYSPIEKLIVMKDMTKNLKKSDATNLPVFNKEVLDKTLSDLKQSFKEDKKAQFDFSKKYKANLTEFYLKGSEFNENESKWIVIPSKAHDRENFDANVKKLQNLSNTSWCTKGDKAEYHLAMGDFHIYMDHGNPKIGLRFEDNRVAEFQDKNNNGRINPKDFDTLKTYLADNKFKMKSDAVVSYYASERAIEKTKQIKKDLALPIKHNDAKSIYNYFGIGVRYDKDGGMILSNYKMPEGVNYSDFGADENKLFQNVVKIEGDADFTRSELTDTHNLKEIKGDTTFFLSKIKDLPNLEKIGGTATFAESRLESTGALKDVGSLDMKNSRIKDLGVLGNVDENFTNAPFLESLKGLKSIGGNANFNPGFNSLKDFGALEYIGGNANLSHVKADSLGNLAAIEGDANFENSNIKTLGNLEYIGGDADFSGAAIDDTGALEEVGGRIIAPKYSIDDNLHYKLSQISSQYGEF